MYLFLKVIYHINLPSILAEETSGSIPSPSGSHQYGKLSCHSQIQIKYKQPRDIDMSCMYINQ